jgi:hypothetical protein
LANDTGRLFSDDITFDPTIVGAVSDASGVALFAALDDGPLVDVSAGLSGNNFSLTETLLDQVAGGSLFDGQHQVSIVAEDIYGNLSDPVIIDLLLDRTPPSQPTNVDLVDASDSGSRSDDNLTNLTSVTVMVASEPNTDLQVLVDGVIVDTLAAGAGEAFVTIDSLDGGIHTIWAVAIDPAGNESGVSESLEIVVDLDAPTIPAFSVTEPTTGMDTASLSGQTDPNTTVQL